MIRGFFCGKMQMLWLCAACIHNKKNINDSRLLICGPLPYTFGVAHKDDVDGRGGKTAENGGKT